MIGFNRVSSEYESVATETELKLAIDPTNVERFLNHPLVIFANNSQRTIKLQGTYFDTPDHQLLSQNISLRVRKEDDDWIQALKTFQANTAGIHQRHEWETIVRENAPELDKLPFEIKQSVFADSDLCNTVGPVFNVNVERRLWTLNSANGDDVELCLDQGMLSTQTALEAISEIELELKSGNPASLVEMAIELLETIPLSIENRTKSKRGYNLLAPELVTYHKSDILNLTKKRSAENVFVCCMQSCIEHLQENEAVTFQGGEPEGVHQMRVALRRLRSALTFFKPLIPLESYRDLKPQIKWLSDLMGPVRDWDVFIISLQDMLQQESKQATLHHYLTQVLDNARREQHKHQANLIKAMKSPQYTKLFLCLSQWLLNRPWREYVNSKQLKKLDAPVKQYTNKRLGKIYSRLLRYGGDSLSLLTPVNRHKVRIKSKEFAYSLRFVSTLYPGAVNYLDLLSNLRDDLGILNDNYTAKSLMKTPNLIPENETGSNYIHGWYAALENIALNDLDKNWSFFLSQPEITAKTR